MNQLALFPISTQPLPLLQDPPQAPAPRPPLGAVLRSEPEPWLACVYCGEMADRAPACTPCLSGVEAEAAARHEYERRP